jgi:hypothetical protein
MPLNRHALYAFMHLCLLCIYVTPSNASLPDHSQLYTDFAVTHITILTSRHDLRKFDETNSAGGSTLFNSNFGLSQLYPELSLQRPPLHKLGIYISVHCNFSVTMTLRTIP